mgnify:CR=1 FL=1
MHINETDEQSSLLSCEKIKNELETDVLGRKLIVLDEIDSTNNYAKQLARENANIAHRVSIRAMTE